MEFLTFSAQNKFSFICPIFDVSTQMRACVRLRDKVYRADRVEVRRGCQACITSSKCPAAEIVRRIAFNSSTATDELSSKEEITGKLPSDILEAILPVMVMEQTLVKYGVSHEERELIASSGERIAKQMTTAPRNRNSAPKPSQTSVDTAARRRAVVPAVTVEKPESAAINKAAAQGDLSAAIN